MSNIIKISNPFKRHEKEIVPIPPGFQELTLNDVRYCPEVLKTLDEGVDVVVALNGEIMPTKKWRGTKVQQNDFVLVVPRVADGGKGDKGWIGFVAMIVVIWAAPAIAGWAVGASVGTAYEIAVIGVMAGGAMVINALTPRPKPPSSIFDETELSQTYGWNPATAQRQGMVRPRFYGLNKMYGNVVEAFTEVTGVATNLQTLYALLNLGTGPYREVVVPGTLKVNDQLIDNFDDVFYQTRPGLIRQNHIGWFEKTKVEFTPNYLVKYGKPKIYETKNADFDDIEIDLTFPRGLYDATGESLANNTVNITIDIKKSVDSAWTNLVTENITDDVADKVIRSYTTNGNIFIVRGNKYQVRVTKNTAERDSNQYGDDLFLERAREVTDEQFTYPRAALVGLKALATEQLSGTIRFSCLARGLYVVNYRDSAGAIEYSNNPADVIADILTQPVFSGEPSPWTVLNLMLFLNGADEAVATVDSSPQGHTVNFTGTAELDTAEKKFGSASLLLDGDSDDINIADSRDWDVCGDNADDCIIDFFVKHDDHDGTEVYVGQYEDATNYWMLYHVHGSGLRFVLVSGGSTIIDTGSGGEIADTNWHHITLIKIGDNYGIYKDGTQIVHTQDSSVDTLAGSLFIGQKGDDSDWFDGHIDHVRIVKRNIFNAAPNDTPDDTIIVPSVEYTDPGPSFKIERYDGYNPSDLDLFALEDLADWCEDVQVNPMNFTISSISQAVNAVISTTSVHNLRVGNVVLFRGVGDYGMVEIADGTTATVIAVPDDTHLTIDLDTSGYTAFDAQNWFGINSSHYDSHCGDSGVNTVEAGLDGTGFWSHLSDETHWVILDLGQTYSVQKVRGRSDYANFDPTDVNIYVSNDKGDFGAAVASGINTWQDTRDWVEVDTTDKEGRYVKVEIIDTEDAGDSLGWGDVVPSPITIFDVRIVQSGATVEKYKPRFTFNGGFDTESNMWDSVLRVCELCRCVPYFKGSKISFAIDKAATAVFAYTSGNIIRDSFRQIFIPTKERAREVEVHYRDAEQDYQRQPFTLINPNIINLTARARMDLFGITDSEMARRIADVILLKNQYIKTIAKFSADIDSIACTIGDPILAPIDATKYGQVGDGRVISATNSGNAVVTVQGALEFPDANWEGGSTAYRLMVKLADDTIETKAIIDSTRDSAGGETSIMVSGEYATIPVKGDLWAAGKEEYETKKYRVVNLRQSERQRIEITATEYVDEVYAND